MRAGQGPRVTDASGHGRVLALGVSCVLAQPVPLFLKQTLLWTAEALALFPWACLARVSVCVFAVFGAVLPPSTVCPGLSVTGCTP